jgi:hypothetical protein
LHFWIAPIEIRLFAKISVIVILTGARIEGPRAASEVTQPQGSSSGCIVDCLSQARSAGVHLTIALFLFYPPLLLIASRAAPKWGGLEL